MIGELFSNWRCRFFATAVVAALAAQPAPAAAQGREYPCIRAIHNPGDARLEQAGVANARSLAGQLAERYREMFTPELLVDTEKLYLWGTHLAFDHTAGEWKRTTQPPAIRIEPILDNPTVKEVVTLSLYPAYHGDVIEAFADRMGAISYRTITPTCIVKYQPPGDQEIWPKKHITLFLLPDGTIALMQYSGFWGVESQQQIAKNRKNKKRQTTDWWGPKLSLIALPYMPVFGREVDLPKADPQRANRLQLYSGLTGMSSQEVEQLYRERDDLEKTETLNARNCEKFLGFQKSMPAHLAHVPRFAYVGCRGGPVPSGAPKIAPTSEQLAAIRAKFDTSTRLLRLTSGTEMVHVSMVDAEGRKRFAARIAAEDRADRAAQRRADAAAISSGIAMGMQSAQQSFDVDDQRAAAAANARFAAQYGCQTGSCANPRYGAVLKAEEVGASGPRQQGALVGSPPKGTDYKPPPVRDVELETKQGAAFDSTGYRNGQQFRSDSEMCAGIKPATVGKVIPSTVSACTCEDRDMGARTRVCKVTFDYTVGRPTKDPEELTGSER